MLRISGAAVASRANSYILPIAIKIRADAKASALILVGIAGLEPAE